MTLYLARHGRSVGRGLFLGQADRELSEEGMREAERLAEKLVRAGVERVVSSGLRRSIQTAERVAARLRLPVMRDARLDELDYGRWNGLAWEEIERRWPREARAKLADWWAVTPAGGEAQAVFLERVRSVWRELCAAPCTTAIAGHLGVNGLLAELAGGGEPDWRRVTRFKQNYGEVARIQTK